MGHGLWAMGYGLWVLPLAALASKGTLSTGRRPAPVLDRCSPHTLPMLDRPSLSFSLSLLLSRTLSHSLSLLLSLDLSLCTSHFAAKGCLQPQNRATGRGHIHEYTLVKAREVQNPARFRPERTRKRRSFACTLRCARARRIQRCNRAASATIGSIFVRW